MSRKAIHRQIFNYASIGMAACIPFSEKACTWLILLIAANWITEGNILEKIKTAYKNSFVILCTAFYMMEIAGLFYTHHFTAGYFHAQTEASFFALPLLYFGYGKIKEKQVNRILTAFSIAVFLASLYCVIIGIFNYENTKDISYLFFHALVSPIHLHPVYFAVYTFICIAYLFDKVMKSGSATAIILSVLLLIYFSLLLFLLRSKVVVGVTFIYAIYQLAKNVINNKRPFRWIIIYPLLLIGLILTALFTPNPFSRQVALLDKPELSVLHESKFDPNDRFDDISIRLTLGKFCFEILNDNHAWAFGVSPGDAQHDVNQKVLESGMFAGYPGTEDHGFLNYNLHNQYLQCLLNSGIAGLLLLAGILFIVFKKALKLKSKILLSVIFVFTAFFLTESVLERQMGIVPFFFFISILILQEQAIAAKPPVKKKKYDKALETIC